MAELMAKDAEGAGGVAEAAGDVAGGFLIDEVARRASYWRCKGK
jgi:hypothetical protein